MKEMRVKQAQKLRRARRVRRKLLKDKDRLRLSVFRSNKHIYAQIIDDVKGVTVVSASEKELEGVKGPKTGIAMQVGTLLAKKASEKKIKEVAFDKGPYRYHGRVKQLAEGAREGGLQF